MSERHRTRHGQVGAVQARVRQGRRGRADTVTRFLHAVLMGAFLGSWLSAEWEGLRAWHIACGHVLAVAWLARIAWSLARPQVSLARWWRTLWGAARRLRSGHAGVLRAPTWSIAGLAVVVVGIELLVPGCFVSGWVLGRLVDASAGPVVLHRLLGTALMVVVATHVALVGVLGVLRGRCMVCDVLPGGGARPRGPDSGRG